MTTKKTTLKSVFLTGLLVLVPLAITLWVLGLVIGTMDQTLLLLPESWQPERAVRLPSAGPRRGADARDHVRRRAC